MPWVSPVTTIEAMLGGLYRTAVESISPAPIAYWPLNEETGATDAEDTIGAEQDLTYVGGVTHANASPLMDGGRIATFDGSTGRAVRADTALAPTSAFTLAIWFRPTSVTGSRWIGSFGGQPAGNVGYSIWQNGSTLVFSVTGTGVIDDCTFSTLVVGTTYFVVGTFNGTAKLYVNGVLVDTSAPLGTPIN